jgi:arylsulfatase A-like enzyme
MRFAGIPVSVTLCLLLFACSLPEQKKQQPNIVFILADDLGYGDLGSYGQQLIATPRLDKLAQNGIRFTQFYAGSTVCAPSRDAYLTGRHTGHTFVRGNVGWPRGDAPLPAEDITVAEVLQEAGYATGVFGKWSLGLAETTGTPARQGFDAFFGYEDQSEAHHYYVSSLQTIHDGETVSVPVDSTAYSHDLIFDAALDFVRQHANTPFFVYLPITIPHAEILVPDASRNAYLDATGKSVFSPEKPYPGNGYASQTQPRATFAGMISHLDRDVGRLVDLLDSLGVASNTILFFTSDNGPHREGGADPDYFDSNGPLRGYKRDFYEGGIRVPMIVWGPGIVRPSESSLIWAAWDLLPTFGDLAGGKVPDGIDGVSFAPLLRSGTHLNPDRYLYWEIARNSRGGFVQAIRKDRWKGIRFFEEAQIPRFELYDLQADLEESINVAAGYPDEVDLLVRLMNEAHQPAALDEFRLKEPTELLKNIQ